MAVLVRANAPTNTSHHNYDDITFEGAQSFQRHGGALYLYDSEGDTIAVFHENGWLNASLV